MPRLFRRAAVLLAAAFICACRSEPLPSEEPPAIEIETGPQRIEWDQPALAGTDVASYRFVLYVDGIEKELINPACGELQQSGSHLCSAELPPLEAGRHEVALTAVNEKAGQRLESRRSLSFAIETR